MTGLSLHDYQEVGRDYVRGRGKAALLMDMGLGKTATCLSALEPRHLPVLVVAPKRVAETVWTAETALWRPDLTCEVAMGDPAARRAVLTHESADIVALGRDNTKDLMDLKRARPFRTVIIDELSGYKDHTSRRFRMTRHFLKRTGVDFVWGLTGTPSPNGLMDLWAQIFLLDGGERLGTGIGKYRNRYFDVVDRLPNGVVIKWALKPGAAEQIYAKIEDIVLAMKTDGRIVLPTRHENTVMLDLPKTSRDLYEKFKEELTVDLKDLFDGNTVVTAANAAALTSRLAQISAGFLFEDYEFLPDDPDDPYTEYTHVNKGAYHTLNDVKIKELKHIVEESQGSPILVAYRFIPEKEAILANIPGAVSIGEKDAIARWNRGEIPVLVAHPQSAGHGLNLQHGGHIMVWTTASWSLEDWEQMIKRLHRQGQKHDVVIHVLHAAPIDGLTRTSLTLKAMTQDDLLANMESPI